MEWNVLVFEARSIDDLVKQYKSDIASSAREGFFQSRERLSADLSFDASDGIPATRLLVFMGVYYANMSYCVLVMFSRETEDKWRAFISVIGEVTRHGTDFWLEVVDRFTKPILASLKRVETVYSSAWIFDSDEMVREKAVFALKRMDAGIAVEPLVNLLRHDKSDAIRESAARSLGQIGSEEAANALQRAASNYIHGDRSRHGVAAACAEALGTMASRESLEDLRELLEIFEKKNLSIQARTVKKAIYRIERGKDLQETICIVCNQPAEEGSKLLQCPACKGVAHRQHILEWLHVKDYCPACRKHLDAQLLVQPSALH
jgi:rubrerythrin